MNSAEEMIKNSSFVSANESGILNALNSQAEYASFCCSYYKPLRDMLPFASLGELEKLPFTDSETIRAHGREMLCVSAGNIHRIVSLFSSGTTDEPKRIYFTKGDLQRTVDFFAEGMGWLCEKGDTVGVLLPCHVPDGVGDLLCRGLEKLGCRPLRLGLVEKAADMRGVLLREKPQVLVGMPWQLRLLALCVPRLSPRRVLLSADYVPESIYAFLEEHWGCQVLAHFGMTESCFGCAVEHPSRRGMYLRRDEFIAEIIDPESGEVLPEGEVGELVLTSLRREAMPLIRYRTGDLARLSSDTPGVIERVYGRLDAHPGNYRLQELFCRLDWLYDYKLKAAAEGKFELTALMSEAAPDNADRILFSLAAEAFPAPESAFRLVLKSSSPTEAAMLRAQKRSAV